MVNLSTGGGSFTLYVEKESGIPLIDIPVYVFSSSGSYLGINAHTDDQGQVSFDLADGDYKFRADYFGYQFFSDVYTVPGTLSDVLTITHQDVTVTVNQVYGVDIDPLQGINVYLFTGSGSYQGIYEVTDANGQVTFNLPEKDYKVRADYLSAQYWSDVFSWQDVGVDIEHGTAILHVTHNGQDLYDVPVYLFTESGSYLSRFERTDSSGQVKFLLPANSYKFRVDYDGTQYWSNVITLIPHGENNIDLQLELLADLINDPNPDRFDGVPPEYQPEKIMVASLGSIRGLLLHSVVGQTTGAQKIYYFINDHLGTPQKLLDESAGVVWSADYKPFGEADVYVNTFENRFRFPGQYYDSETGIHYNWHRYYDPSIGRYLRADPIGLDGGLNLYAYASLNPFNSFDFYGLRDWTMRRRGFGLSAVIVSFSHQTVEFVSDCDKNKMRTIKTYRVVGLGLTVGIGAQAWGNWGGEKDESKGYFGNTNVYKEDPNPITGISVSGPSAGIIKGGTIASASLDFTSFADVYAATTEKRLGLSLFNFEGQRYKLIGIRTESCCE